MEKANSESQGVTLLGADLGILWFACTKMPDNEIGQGKHVLWVGRAELERYCKSDSTSKIAVFELIENLHFLHTCLFTVFFSF